MNAFWRRVAQGRYHAVGLSDYGPQAITSSGRWAAGPSSTVPRRRQNSAMESAHGCVFGGRARRRWPAATLVHGDYAHRQHIFDATGTQWPCVLDWELSPSAILLRIWQPVIMQWQLPSGSEGRRHGRAGRLPLGLPSDAEFISQYWRACAA